MYGHNNASLVPSSHQPDYESRVHSQQDATLEDASLLAAFADMANKTAFANPPSSQHNSSPYTSHTYCDIEARPRTVSDPTSVMDGNPPTISTTMGSPLNDGPVEIRPNHNEERVTSKVRYTTILKKKFSWKNYPPLENFLIANRDEYLRHSTLNYTLQQKQYNNYLTKQMIQLAAQCHLIFDDNDFSFVSIRDRIRCYYKSYVQSLKKRGVILGYAARKAGLVSDDAIQLSASTAGKIYLPKVV